MFKAIKFDGIVDLQPLQNFYENFQQPLQLPTVPNSGLICFIRGYESEALDEQIIFYQTGVNQFLDPLCAYALAQIYADHKRDKEIAYYYMLLSLPIAQQYGDEFRLIKLLSVLNKELQIDNKQIIEDQAALLQGAPIQQFTEIILQNMNYQLDKISYFELIQSYLQIAPTLKQSNEQSILILQLIQMLVHNMKTENKQIDSLISIFQNAQLLPAFQIVSAQLLTHLELMKNIQADNTFYHKTREHMFELIFIIKNILGISTDKQKFNQIPNFVKISSTCGAIWNNIIAAMKAMQAALDKIEKNIHKSLALRWDSDVLSKGNPYNNVPPQINESIELQLKELQIPKPTQFSYALAHYNLAKLYRKAHKQEESQTHLKKAEDLFIGRLLSEQLDPFLQIITYYYLSRIFSVLKKLDDEIHYLNLTLQYVIFPIRRILKEPQNLQLVRTLQYHTIQRKVIKRLPLCQEHLNQRNKTIEQERSTQMKLLEQQRKTVSLINQTASQKHSESRLLTDTVHLNRSQGPIVSTILETNKIHAETAIQMYMKRINQQQENQEMLNSVQRKLQKFKQQDGLFFVNPDDIEFNQLIQKGSFQGGVYKVIIQGKKYAMKQLIIQKESIDSVLVMFNTLSHYSHPNLRKPLAFNVEQSIKDQINLGILYDFADSNLYLIDTLDFKTRLQITIDVIGAVNYLHSKKTYHGNIKPQNILIRNTGDQYFGIVTDWELTKHIYQTHYNEIPSQFGWSAPEVYLDGQKPNIQTDLWSCGMILLFTLFNLNVAKQPRGLQNPYESIEVAAENHELLQIVLPLLNRDPKERVPLEIILKNLLLFQ